MTHSDRAVRAGGTWLAVASLLMVIVFVLHGPIAPDLQDQMTRIADAAVRWSVVHWVAAIALSLYVVSGMILLTSRSRLTEGLWRLTAWGIVCLGALWTLITAVVETTVVARAAESGTVATFLAWWEFAEGMANGFSFFALAIAVIAGTEARHPAGATPPWAAWTGAAAGIGSFTGWALGMWLGIAPGNLLWVLSSLVMSVWILWFGIALMRTPARAAAANTQTPGRGREQPRTVPT